MSSAESWRHWAQVTVIAASVLTLPPAGFTLWAAMDTIRSADWSDRFLHIFLVVTGVAAIALPPWLGHHYYAQGRFEAATIAALIWLGWTALYTFALLPAITFGLANP